MLLDTESSKPGGFFRRNPRGRVVIRAVEEKSAFHPLQASTYEYKKL
jgi:hypothetical protein